MTRRHVLRCLFLIASLPLCVYAGDGEPTVITTYFWQEGWVEHASWDASFLGPEIRISFDAWNWEPEFSNFTAEFDNLYAFGDLDLPQGLIDDFDDGLIGPIWEGSGGSCVPGAGAAACEMAGSVEIDILAGEASPGQNRVAGLRTVDLVAQGEFDVRIDFSLNPEFHSTPNANVKLILPDAQERFPEMSIRTGQYESHEVGPDFNVIINVTPTDHLVGKLRITRTLAGRLFADGFESGDLSAWSSSGP